MTAIFVLRSSFVFAAPYVYRIFAKKWKRNTYRMQFTLDKTAANDFLKFKFM